MHRLGPFPCTHNGIRVIENNRKHLREIAVHFQLIMIIYNQVRKGNPPKPSHMSTVLLPKAFHFYVRAVMIINNHVCKSPSTVCGVRSKCSADIAVTVVAVAISLAAFIFGY